MAREPAHPKPGATDLDYSMVARYWQSVRTSILGPYMMDDFGFPPGAGQFRLRGEKRIISRLMSQCSRQGTALDLGSGIGYWTEFFAHRFAQVVAVEASRQLFDTLEKRCNSLPNATLLHQNARSFQPRQDYEVVFTGGLLMYLNDVDVVELLRKVRPCLGPRNLVICRESTIRGGSVTRNDEYQVVYRSVSNYERMFQEAGFEVVSIEPNVPYILMQMGCELIKWWKKTVPQQWQVLPLTGRLTYFTLRLGNPWIVRIPAMLGLVYPRLTNHFFVLRPRDENRQNSGEGTVRS